MQLSFYTSCTGISLNKAQPKELRNTEEKATISGDFEGGQVNLRILASVAEFEELRDAWSAWTQCPEADLDYFSIHLRHTPGVIRPHVMVAYRGGCPDCILVGWLHRGVMPFKVGSFTLFRPDVRILRFVNGGFLGNQSHENSRLLLGEILGSLRRHEAHAIEFSQLTADTPLYDLAKRQPSLLCRDQFTPLQPHRYLTMPANFDEFLCRLSSKYRSELRRYVRLLESDFPGNVRLRTVLSDSDVEDFASTAGEISQKTYKGALGIGFVNDLETREVLHAAAKKNVLRAFLLYIGERPVAFNSAILSNKTLYGISTGYDPEFKKYRPGLQTMMRLIEQSFASNGGILRIDAGCGDSPYKRSLFDSRWQEAPVWIFAPSAIGFRLHLSKLVSTLLHSLAMWLSANNSLLRRAKKMLQRQALRRSQRTDPG